MEKEQLLYSRSVRPQFAAACLHCHGCQIQTLRLLTCTLRCCNLSLHGAKLGEGQVV
jgi:hypothetical protein